MCWLGKLRRVAWKVFHCFHALVRVLLSCRKQIMIKVKFLQTDKYLTKSLSFSFVAKFSRSNPTLVHSDESLHTSVIDRYDDL